MHTNGLITTSLATVQTLSAKGKDPLEALNNLNSIVSQLQSHAAVIGITLGGLMVGVYAMLIMLSHDNSAMANRNRWEHLQKVLICSGIIAGTGALIQLAKSLGGML